MSEAELALDILATILIAIERIERRLQVTRHAISV